MESAVAAYQHTSNIDKIGATLDQHLLGCDTFRKMTLGALALAIGIIGSAFGFMISELYEIKGRQDGVIQRIENLDRSLAATRDDMTQRFAAVVNANAQRENTFNERFKDLNLVNAEMRKQLYELEKIQWQRFSPQRIPQDERR